MTPPSPRGFKDYAAYLNSAEWADVKRRYRDSDLPQDCCCGESTDLDFHHLTYERVGREALEDLTPLCRPCHRALHALEARGDASLNLRALVNETRAQRYGRNTPTDGESWDELHARRLATQQATTSNRSIEKRLSRLRREMDPATFAGLMERVLAEAQVAIDAANPLRAAATSITA